jgi:hypothetical protein
MLCGGQPTEQVQCVIHRPELERLRQEYRQHNDNRLEIVFIRIFVVDHRPVHPSELEALVPLWLLLGAACPPRLDRQLLESSLDLQLRVARLERKLDQVKALSAAMGRDCPRMFALAPASKKSLNMLARSSFKLRLCCEFHEGPHRVPLDLHPGYEFQADKEWWKTMYPRLLTALKVMVLATQASVFLGPVGFLVGGLAASFAKLLQANAGLLNAFCEGGTEYGRHAELLRAIERGDRQQTEQLLDLAAGGDVVRGNAAFAAFLAEHGDLQPGRSCGPELFEMDRSSM